MADAFKHYVIGRPNSTVSGASAIVSIGNGFGEMRYGEEKYGGREQVTVTRKTATNIPCCGSARTATTPDEGPRFAGAALRRVFRMSQEH